MENETLSVVKIKKLFLVSIVIVCFIIIVIELWNTNNENDELKKLISRMKKEDSERTAEQLESIGVVKHKIEEYFSESNANAIKMDATVNKLQKENTRLKRQLSCKNKGR